MKRKLMLLLACLFVGIGLVTAQNQTVTGVVISEEDGQPVIGASVRVENTQLGAITDVDGKFRISNVPSSANTLIISYIGMEEQKVAIKPNLRVVMRTNSEMLDEVMVVAFGTAKKSAFTGSATVLDNEKLEQSQVTSVTNALAGAVPGVTLTSDNGAPGASSKIKIRGFSSLNAGNDPLIIVDGAPYSGDLANLNPNDVESMTVLKDAASNALYGARGANGVVIITTKRASERGDAVVTFDAKWGANTRALQQYDVITSPAQYYEMHYGALNRYYQAQGMSADAAWRQANANLCSSMGNGGVGYNVYTVPDGQYLIGQNGKLNPYATLGRVVNYNGKDYLLIPDDIMDLSTRTGLRQEYNFSVSAANEKSSFYASLGYLGNEGITENSDYKRLSARLRADYQAKKWLKIGGNMSYARFDQNSLNNNGSSTSSGNVWAYATQMAPIYPGYLRNADGSIMIDENGFQMMDYGNGMNAGMARPQLSDANPLMDNMLNTSNSEGNALTANGFVDITPIEGLKITLNGTVNLDETRGTYVYNPYYGQFDTTGGTVEKYHTRTYDYNLQQLISYARSFGSNNFDILLGHEYYDYRYAILQASKSKMFSQDNQELGGAVVDGQSAYSGKSRHNNEGYFARLQYNYDERIFGSGSIRRDASSRFAPDHRWGTFWSVGAAWLINKESWFNAPWVQELKIKASVGSQGNDNIGLYRYTDVFNIINSSGEIGTSFNTKGSEDITWETNTNFNVGAEFQLWNRVTGSIEYYFRKTSDMLFSFSVAPSLGYSSYFDNVGNMNNQGVEIDLGVNIFNTRDFKWDVNLNVSTLKNRLTMLDEGKKTDVSYSIEGKAYEGYTNGSFFIAEGLPIYTWREKVYAGVDPETGLSMWYKMKTDAEGNFIGNTTTSTYSEADYYVTEESTLPKVYGGFGTTLQAYGVDFSINFTYSLGGKQYDGTYATFMSSPTSSNTGFNFHKDLLNSWTPENPDTDIPRFQFGDTYSGASAGSTRFLTNASYLNLQNINVGYTLPASWTRKLAINSLRVYLSAENVYYWSKRKGFDPRQSFDTTTNNTYYSPMRTISGGVTFKF